MSDSSVLSVMHAVNSIHVLVLVGLGEGEVSPITDEWSSHSYSGTISGRCSTSTSSARECY